MWYEGRCVALGAKFIDAVWSGTRLVAENPERNAIRFDDVRRLNLKRFPYSIWYIAHSDLVYILGVIHNKRDHRRLLEQRRQNKK